MTFHSPSYSNTKHFLTNLTDASERPVFQNNLSQNTVLWNISEVLMSLKASKEKLAENSTLYDAYIMSIFSMNIFP